MTEDQGSRLQAEQSAYCWQIGKTMTESNAYMLENQIRCDVTFKLKTSTGDEKTLGAHMFVLTSRSPVFEAMLSDRWSTVADVIKLDDVDYDGMMDFLRYLYTEVCEIKASNVLCLQYLSRKYMQVHLESACDEYIKGEIGVENVCTLLQNSLDFHDKDTYKLCMSFIKDNTNNVFDSIDFLSMTRDALYQVLSADILACENGEEDVYNSCVRWARYQCRLEVESEVKEPITDEQAREALGPCLYLIRLPTLPHEPLMRLLGGSQVVSYEEKGMINEYVHQKEPLKLMPFPCKTRRFSLRINRFDFAYSILYTRSLAVNPIVDCIHFSADKEILLYGVTFQASECGKLPKGTLKLTIDSETSEAQLHGGSQRKLGVKFPTRRISANLVVALEVTWDRNEEEDEEDNHFLFPVYFDQRGYEPNRVSVLAPDGTVFSFLKSEVKNNSSTVTHGQFPQLMFFSTVKSGPPYPPLCTS